MKNTITASFQTQIGWKRQRQREKKNYHTVRSFPTGKRKFQKNSKKIQKIEKYHYGFIPSQNRLENAEKWRNKNYRNVSFLPDGQEKIPKKWQKKLKKLKETITDSSQAKIGGKMLRKRENKNYHSVSFLPNGEEKIPKK